MKITLLALSLLLAVSSAQAEEPVYFADANLKAAVETALGVSNPTPTQMLELTFLWVTYKEITNPKGLEYATNLRTLGLGHNSLTGIGPLAGLTNLEVTYLDSNKISDLSPLSG
jgi:Leucine-rich repeat (LRR) protein